MRMDFIGLNVMWFNSYIIFVALAIILLHKRRPQSGGEVCPVRTSDKGEGVNFSWF